MYKRQPKANMIGLITRNKTIAVLYQSGEWPRKFSLNDVNVNVFKVVSRLGESRSMKLLFLT